MTRAELGKCFQKLNEICLCCMNDGWDGYSAQAISHQTIDRVLHILNSNALTFEPEIFPTGRNTIQFEYGNVLERYFEFEIGEDENISYLMTEDRDVSVGVTTSIEDIDNLCSEMMLRRLCL